VSALVGALEGSFLTGGQLDETVNSFLRKTAQKEENLYELEGNNERREY